MKFTLEWLKEHLDTDADATAVSETLTRIGLEVEGIENTGAKLAAFRIAKVLAAAPHPQADKLQVLSVDAGAEEFGGPLQVVCGAPNARAGLVGVFGAPGAVVPANGMVLKVAAIRGVESNGMMCSVRELELGDEHDGIIELPADAPVGEPYAAWAGLDQILFDVAITPNRQDCMGVRGIARDLAAAGLGTLKPLGEVYRFPSVRPGEQVAEPPARLGAAGGSSDLLTVEGSSLSLEKKNEASTSSARTVPEVRGTGPMPDIRIEDPEGCPAFFAQAVSGVTNGESPRWMREKLGAIGQKPISALVDITNFISIDLGRPLHVYDRAKLSGPLAARKARDGEQVQTLNGKTYTLDHTMTVIADDAGVHDIGGIMGGAHSGVSATTTDVIIECAYFDPDHIARTGQKLSLTSDARQRFERGVDPAFLDDGLAIATRLVLDHCGGTPSAVVRVGQPPVTPRTVSYDPALAETLGGVTVAAERQAAILASLGFSLIRHPREGGGPTPDDEDQEMDSRLRGNDQGGSWTVTIPSWRRDIDGPADLVEEVVRITGLDHIASVPLPRAEGVARPTATPAQKIERKVRRTAAARGLNEAITWSFLSEAEAAVFGGGAWTLANPISEELKVMRPSLLAGLLSAARRNADRGADSIRLFEIGRRYLADAERPTVGVVLAGERAPRGWASGKAQAFDAFDAKAEALALLEAAGAPVENLQVFGEAGDHFHPGQSGTLRLGPKTVLAGFGMLHPTTARAFDLSGPVAVAEIYLDAVPAKRASGFMRTPFTPPALQVVRRDFAFLVPADLASDALVRAVKGADKANIVAARLFDRFDGAGVSEGQVSLAIEVTLQPLEKSYAEADLKAIADRIVAAVARIGAVQRG